MMSGKLQSYKKNYAHQSDNSVRVMVLGFTLVTKEELKQSYEWAGLFLHVPLVSGSSVPESIGWIGMDGIGYLSKCNSMPHGKSNLADHVSGMGAEDIGPVNSSVKTSGIDPDPAMGSAIGNGAVDTAEGKTVDFVTGAVFSELFFSSSYMCHLRICISAPWHVSEIGFHGKTGQHAADSDFSHMFSRMRELHLPGDIAAGINVRTGCLAALVYDNSVISGFYTGGFEVKLPEPCLAASGYKQGITMNGPDCFFGVAAQREGDFSILFYRSGYLLTQVKYHALFFEMFPQL